MSVVIQDDWLTVHHGDARAVLPTLEVASIDAAITSPPYWRQRSYLAPDDPLKPLEMGSEEHFDGWVADLVEVCRGIRRVLKPEGSLWLVLGDRYVAHGGQYPNTESRRRGEDFSRHVPRRTTLTGFPAGVRRKSLLLAPYRLALAMCEDGWILRDRVVWAKTNGLPESVGDRLHVRDEVIFRFTLREKAYFDVDAIREAYAVSSIRRHARGQAPFNPKGRAGEPSRIGKIWTGRQGDAHRADWHRAGRIRVGARVGGKNPGNVWPVATAGGGGSPFAHFAMFPAALIRRPILATVPVGGVVLDPFAGTGTTAEVANEHMRRAVLIELDPASIEHIRIRCQRRPIVAVPA
jgi:site-specific DNA-methyltransferase (cytosine-N4-specific)